VTGNITIQPGDQWKTALQDAFGILLAKATGSF
jgi:hypothetical protein